MPGYSRPFLDLYYAKLDGSGKPGSRKRYRGGEWNLSRGSCGLWRMAIPYVTRNNYVKKKVVRVIGRGQFEDLPDRQKGYILSNMTEVP